MCVFVCQTSLNSVCQRSLISACACQKSLISVCACACAVSVCMCASFCLFLYCMRTIFHSFCKTISLMFDAELFFIFKYKKYMEMSYDILLQSRKYYVITYSILHVLCVKALSLPYPCHDFALSMSYLAS